MSSSKAVRTGCTLLVGCVLLPAVAWFLDIGLGRMLAVVAVFTLLPAAAGVLPGLSVAGWLGAIGGLIPMLLVGPVLWWMGGLGEIGFLRFAVGWGLFILSASILQAGMIVVGQSALRLAAHRASGFQCRDCGRNVSRYEVHAREDLHLCADCARWMQDA